MLTAYTLQYFESEEISNVFNASDYARGSVDLAGANLLEGPGAASRSTPTDFAFRLALAKRTYTFCTDTESDRLMWTVALQAVLSS